MYCPRCRCEYIPGVEECPDCRVPLVRRLPPEPAPQYVEWVTVLATTNTGLLSVAQSLLEEEGIKFFTKGEAFHNAGYGSFPALLQVRPQDAEEAARILADLSEEPTVDAPEDQ